MEKAISLCLHFPQNSYLEDFIVLLPWSSNNTAKCIILVFSLAFPVVLIRNINLPQTPSVYLEMCYYPIMKILHKQSSFYRISWLLLTYICSLCVLLTDYKLSFSNVPFILSCDQVPTQAFNHCLIKYTKRKNRLGNSRNKASKTNNSKFKFTALPKQ